MFRSPDFEESPLEAADDPPQCNNFFDLLGVL
jgi:hypothetical protein